MRRLNQNGRRDGSARLERAIQLVREGRTTLMEPVRGPDGLVGEFEVRVDDPECPETSVWIDPADSSIVTDCVCDFLSGNTSDSYCSHILAALLVALARGVMDVRPNPGFCSERQEAEIHKLLAVAEQVRRGDSGFVQGVEDSAWKRRLSAIQETSRTKFRPPVADADRAPEYVYLLDAGETKERGRLCVRMQSRTRLKDGSLGSSRPAQIEPDDFATLANPRDREAWGLLDPVACRGAWWWSGPPADGLYELVDSALPAVLPALAGTGRFYVKTEFGRAEFTGSTPRPFRMDEGDPWEFRIKVRENREKIAWILAGSLHRGRDRLSLKAPRVILPGWFFYEDVIGRISDKDAFSWVSSLSRHGSITVPKSDGEALLQHMHALPLPSTEWPDELRVVEKRLEPKPRVRFEFADGDPRKHPRLRAQFSFQYEDEVVEADDPRPKLLFVSARTVIVRDKETESAFRNEAVERGLELPPAYLRREELFGPSDLQLHPGQLHRVVQELNACGWHVEAEGKLFRQATSFRLGVSSGIDWLDLEGEVRFDDEVVPLPQLLRALRRGENTVVLGDGNFGVLPEAWLRRHGLLLSTGEIEDDRVRFRRSQTLLLDALLASEPESRWDRSYEEARTRLLGAGRILPAEASPAFRGELRPYQKDGLGWFEYLRAIGLGGCLADDMGLGKTVQVLALLDRRAVERTASQDANGAGGSSASRSLRPSLVVVPRSLISNWKSEAERFSPRLRVLDHSGTQRVKETHQFADYDIVLTTYGTMVRDVDYLKDAEFDYVILDEAQAIKNAESNAAKASRLLRGQHRLALSGTPVENHLGELWSLFEFLNPGMLGASSAFDRALRDAQAERTESALLLGKALRPLILRRTKEEVAKDLPERMEQTILCDLGSEERRHYEEIREYYRKSLNTAIGSRGLGRAKIQIIEALLRLRQAACHPGLIDLNKRDRSSSKLALLLEQLREVVDEGHRALVFSQFTKFLGIVRDRLDREGIVYEYLDGRTRNRGEKVERFQSDPACKVFLISLKAGGLGLNLTAADYVFLLDPWWNPAVEAQAIDRAHRIGQTRNVVAYRLVARDTVEERVLALQDRKRKLVEQIITADNGLVRNLAPEDLDLLLS